MPVSVQILLFICFRVYPAHLSHDATNHGVLICTILAGAFVQVNGVVLVHLLYTTLSFKKYCLFCVCPRESYINLQVV